MASSSSSSSSRNTPLEKKNEVFLSFRGKDVRDNFLCLLKEALIKKSIRVFVDENLRKGKDITPALLKEIEESYISIVIFSENYADSEWCLDELEKIIECKKTMGQIVLPVFYKIDPTDVECLTGSYGRAIAKHEIQFKDSLPRVERWRQALKETTGKVAFVSNVIGNDSKLIEKIINEVLEELKILYPSAPNNKLVGIDSRAKVVESLLCLGVPDVRIVGICGMGGIGKTTIAKEVFRRISDHHSDNFACRCFIENVREKLEKGTLETLQRELFSRLFGSEHFSGDPMMLSFMIERCLLSKKVFIVLDDVSDFDQIENLIGSLADCCLGSRIMVTSRDKQILRNENAKIYEVKRLNNSEAHQLFKLHAFKEVSPSGEYEGLSEKAVKYAQGLPLALKVLGSHLYRKSVKKWRDELDRLEPTSTFVDQVQKVLRRSYDGLSKYEKEIFLDIASFYDGHDRDQAVHIMDDQDSNSGISELDDKCLIAIDAENRLHMHDFLKQMGKDIINEKRVGKRRWLTRAEDVEDVLLERAKGTELIKGILLDMSNIRGLELIPTAFQKTTKLRVLKFYNPSFYDVFPREIIHEVRVPSGLEFLPAELRFLRWDRFPLRSLPSNFFAENLVEVHFHGSRLKELWNGEQQLGKLKLIDLRESHALMRIPDLSKAPNLEVLNLRGCSRAEIGFSLQCLTKLKELNLGHCRKLYQQQHQLLNFVRMKSLEDLTLFGWPSITKIPNVPSSITCLRLCYNGIEEVPSSIERLSNLSILDLRACMKLKSLHPNICNLEYLKCLYFSDCVELQSLPDNLGNLKNLWNLQAPSTGIKNLPPSFNQLTKLTVLNFNGCEGIVVPSLSSFANLHSVKLGYCGLSEFPESICSLKSLKSVSLCGNNFKSIPKIIKFSKIELLDLSYCQKLKYLPKLPLTIREYLVKYCKCLKSASVLSCRAMTSGWWCSALKFDNCFDLDPKKCKHFLDSLLAKFWGEDHEVGCEEIFYCKLALRIPGSELPQRMIHKNNKGSILNLSLRQPQCHFTLCVVFYPDVYDGKLARIGCTVSCKDEYRNTKQYQLDYTIFKNRVLGSFELESGCTFESKHVILWRCHQYIPWNNMELQFFATNKANDESGYRNYDAIVKCAVQTLLDKEEEEEEEVDESEEEQEEEAFPKGLKCRRSNEIKLIPILWLIMCIDCH